MNNLYCVSLGETMRTKFIADAEKFAYGQALFVVPGRILMDEVRKNSNMRTVIMDYLPNELLRGNNLENYTRISRPAQEMLIRQIIDTMLAKGELDYFSKLASKKGFIKNLVSFIGELSRGGITCEELQSAFQAWERSGYLQTKDAEIYHIYEQYRQGLKSHKNYDVDGLYRLAIRTLQNENCFVPWTKLYFSEFYQFDNLQIELIKALSQHCAIDIGLFYDAERPDLSKATENAYMDFMGMGFNKKTMGEHSLRAEGINHFVQNWQNSNAVVGAATGISIFEAYSVENEMRGVLGKIKQQLRSGVPCADIICVVRSMEEYNGFSNLFKEFGVPTVLPEVTGFSAQPLAKFISAIMKVADKSHNVETWQELLSNTCADKIFSLDLEELEASYNEKYFAVPQTWQEFVIEKFPQSHISELFAFIATIKGRHTPADFVNKLLQAIEQWSLEAIYGQEYKAGLLTLEQLKTLVTTKNVVSEIFEEMVLAFEQSGQGLKKRPVSDFLEFWQEKAQEKIISLAPGNEQGVKVVEAATIQGVLYPHVYLLGLREGQFPKAKFENWIYNDRERKELNDLGITLPLTINSMKIDQYFFASVVAMAQKSLTISYYVDDAAGASSYLEELRRYYPKEALVPAFYSLKPQNCFSEEELTNILAENENLDISETVWLEQKVGTDFVERRNLDKYRWQGASVFNGFLGHGHSCKHLSASALDSYIQCPFNYLVTNIWHAKPWEQLTQETKPTVTGDLYHLTLAKFLNKHLGENIGATNYGLLKTEILDDLSQTYNELVNKGLIFASDFSAYEYRHYQMVLEKWLAAEQAYQKEQQIQLLPRALELAFGRDEGQLPGLAIKIDGEETVFSGQIDRVDSDGNKYILTDYKSGAVPTSKAVVAGQALQLPIYALALEKIQKIQPEQIIGAGYYDLKNSKRTGGMWEKNVKQDLPWLYNTRPNDLPTVMENAQESIESCIRSIRSGAFPATPVDKCPSYCPCKDICRYKLADGSQNMGEEGEDNG